jgi:hypothetical protein
MDTPKQVILRRAIAELNKQIEQQAGLANDYSQRFQNQLIDQVRVLESQLNDRGAMD